jgi:hypothetical protein
MGAIVKAALEFEKTKTPFCNGKCSCDQEKQPATIGLKRENKVEKRCSKI